VSEFEITIQISKIAAAQRQLDAAIRIFFQREDELAIHTLAAAAFQILRDVTSQRGDHFTSEVFRSGILSIVQQYVQGTLPPDKKAMIEGSSLMPTIAELAEQIRVQGVTSTRSAFASMSPSVMNISFGCPKQRFSSSTLTGTRMGSFLRMV
jgi:hypothetical protein